MVGIDLEYTENSKGVGTNKMRGEQTKEGSLCWYQLGYQTGTGQGKMPRELGLAEKTVITRIIAEKRLKIVIKTSNTGRLSEAPIRRIFLMFEGNRLGLGQGDGPSGAQYLLCPNRQFACISGITSPTDSLVFYHSYPYICL